MNKRRSVLKAIGLASFSIPSIGAFGLEKNTILPSPDSADYWNKVRDQFMLDKNSVFFNPGTVGAMPTVVYDRMTAHLKKMATSVADWEYKDDNKEQYISGYNTLIPIRTKVAKLLNADYQEIAMTDNVTNGMSYLANGLELKAGDEVITTNQEHSGGKSSWMMRAKRHGIIYREIEIPKPIKDEQQAYDLITNAFTPKTRVLVLSHMITGSGAILPVKELCKAARQRGIITILDGAQTIGQIALDVKDIGCDAYLGCFHKWIGAPAGSGFMYVHKEMMPSIWTTIASGFWDNQNDQGYRFTQRGTGSFSILMGLDAALDFHFEIGPQRVYDRIRFLGSRLRDGLRKNKAVRIFSPEAETMCAGITVYNLTGWKGSKLQDAFWEREKMRPRSQGDIFGVRHCTHIFNSEKEIDRAIELVNRLAAEKPQG